MTVLRSGPLEGIVTASVSLKPGTASAGQDYLATSAFLSFLAGETSKTVTIRDLPPRTRFHVTFWNAHGDGQLIRAPDLSSDAHRTIHVKIPPMSVIALTTLNSEG